MTSMRTSRQLDASCSYSSPTHPVPRLSTSWPTTYLGQQPNHVRTGTRARPLQRTPVAAVVTLAMSRAALQPSCSLAVASPLLRAAAACAGSGAGPGPASTPCTSSSRTCHVHSTPAGPMHVVHVQRTRPMLHALGPGRKGRQPPLQRVGLIAQAASSASGWPADPPTDHTPGPAAPPAAAQAAVTSRPGPSPLVSALSTALSPLLGPLSSALSPLLGPLHKYRDIVGRCLVTVVMLAVIRSGLYIPLPGLDMSMLRGPTLDTEGERLIRALYGQASALPASIFDLGISPYVNASIIVTVLLVLPAELISLPWLNRLKEARKEGKSGEAYITSWIHWLALAFAIYTAVLRAIELEPAALMGSGFMAGTALTLVAGSCIVNYAANVITAHGIGSGSSWVICAGIVTEYAETLHSILTSLEAGLLPAWRLALVSGGYLVLVLFAVLLSTSQLRLPVVQYSTTMATPPGQQGGAPSQDVFVQARQVAERKAAARRTASDYFPLILNSSGMLPIIFAGAAYFGFLPRFVELLGLHSLQASLAALQSSLTGLACYGFLVFCMEFLPVGGINPKEVAEYFNMMNVGIKGVVPGETTERYVQSKLLKCKFWGGLALAALAVSAYLFDRLCMVFLGTTLATTSLLIIVGAVMQSSRQVESLLEGPRLQEKLQREQGVIASLRVL